jgi:hypothetical protein
MTVREINDDPQSGKRTTELVNLSQTEPDAVLFEPPEGYEVVTEGVHEVACETPTRAIQ